MPRAAAHDTWGSQARSSDPYRANRERFLPADRVLGDAVAWQYLTMNPAAHTSLPRERRAKLAKE